MKTRWFVEGMHANTRKREASFVKGWCYGDLQPFTNHLTHFENVKFSLNILCSRTTTFLYFIYTIKLCQLFKIVDTIFCVLNKN